MRIDRLLEQNKEQDWELVMEEHLQQIAFFQHERLVHLIVTVTFALLEIISASVFILSGNIGFGALTIAVLILLVPYIRHYYLLENEVQKMYVQYDKILAHIRKMG